MLTNAEWKLMEVLWGAEARTLTELTKLLRDSTGWSKQTIITMLRRMNEKGIVSYREGRKAKLFYPLITREQAETEEVEGVLQRAFHGSSSLMLNAFLKKEKLKEKDILEAIQKLQPEKND